MTDTAEKPPVDTEPGAPRPETAGNEAAENEATAAIDLLDAVRANRRRWMGFAALAFIVGAGAGAAAWAAWDGRNGGEEATDEVAVQLDTVPVETRDLATFAEFDGTLGFSRSEAVPSVAAGTLTYVPETGTDLERGDTLYEVDAEPVVVFYGELPSWRTLELDVDDGRDIAQLEANLWALGYTVDLDDGNGPYLTVDGDYDWATAYAVEQWETDLGLDDPDDVFEPDRVVYLPGEVRVDDPVATGTRAVAGSPVLTATVTTTVADVVDEETATVVDQDTGATERVTLEVATADQSTFTVGDEVDIELADGRTAEGVVAEIGDVARRLGQGANSELVVDIAIDVTTIPDGGLLEGPVTVLVVDESAPAATAVPVRALVALAEGGYGVEIDDGAGRRLVGVETGIFADGWVEVTGVEAGQQVVVPS